MKLENRKPDEICVWRGEGEARGLLRCKSGHCLKSVEAMTLAKAREAANMKARVDQGGSVLEENNGPTVVVFKIFKPGRFVSTERQRFVAQPVA